HSPSRPSDAHWVAKLESLQLGKSPIRGHGRRYSLFRRTSSWPTQSDRQTPGQAANGLRRHPELWVVRPLLLPPPLLLPLEEVELLRVESCRPQICIRRR